MVRQGAGEGGYLFFLRFFPASQTSCEKNEMRGMFLGAAVGTPRTLFQLDSSSLMIVHPGRYSRMSRRSSERSAAAKAAREQGLGAVDVAAMVRWRICDREPWEKDTGSARRLAEGLDRAALDTALMCKHPESDWVCLSCNTHKLGPWKNATGQQKVGCCTCIVLCAGSSSWSLSLQCSVGLANGRVVPVPLVGVPHCSLLRPPPGVHSRRS